MPRKVQGGLAAALAAKYLRPVVFIEAEFASGVLRLHTGRGKVEWDGKEWNGPTGARGGAILTIEPVSEVAGVEATGLRAKLSGLDPEILAKCLDEIRIGKKARLYFGLKDESGQFIEEPSKAFEGFLDAGEMEEGSSGSAITVTAESGLRRLQIPNLRLMTPEDQKIDFPNDTLLKRVAGLKNWKGNWGPRQISVPGSGGGGTTGGGQRDRGERLFQEPMER